MVRKRKKRKRISILNKVYRTMYSKSNNNYISRFTIRGSIYRLIMRIGG